MNSWTLYWITRLDSIGITMFALGLCGTVIISAVNAAAYVLCYDSHSYRPKYLKWIPALIGLIVATAFIPTTREMAAIIVIPKIANAIKNDETASRLPEKIMNLTGEWIEKLRPKN